MKLNNQSDITQTLIQLEGLEFALLNADGSLQTWSPGLSDFVSDFSGDLTPGQMQTDLFPELIGYEDVFAAIRAGDQPLLQIERIYRQEFRGQPGYITLRLLPYGENWLLVASDATSIGLMEQRITQQRNDLSLLAANLEYTRARLDDLLHRFVPEQVADALVADNHQAAPGGIRREVSVLFADLRGFTAWAASREPEVVLTTLNLVFDRVVEILLENKATLDKFVGDAIMAFFNAPNDQPDHALRALACAYQIRDLSLEGLELRFGVGVNSGPVVAGNVGTARAMQYTVLGDTVNIAKRLEEQARPSEVLFGAGFAEHVRGKCQYSKIGHMQLKGYSEPLTVYHLH